MNINELIAKRAKVWETAKNFVDTHEDKNGVLSEEDTAAYNKMEKEIEDLTAAIDRQQRAERREAELNKPINSPIMGKPLMGEEKVKTGRASDEYRDAMLSAMRSNFRNVSNILQEGVDADGGYLVPEEYDKRLIDVHTSSFAPANAIAFGDYSYYNIGDRGSRSFAELRELFAGNGMIGYLAKERVDGKLILPEAVQILKLKEETVTPTKG